MKIALLYSVHKALDDLQFILDTFLDPSKSNDIIIMKFLDLNLNTKVIVGHQHTSH